MERQLYFSHQFYIKFLSIKVSFIRAIEVKYSFLIKDGFWDKNSNSCYTAT